MKRDFLWVVLALCLFIVPAGCEVPPDQVDPPPVAGEVQPGEGLADEVKAADLDAVAGAASILFPPVAPYAGIGLLLWRLIRKHKAGVSAVQSVQAKVDSMGEAAKSKLGDEQTPAAKRLIRQARGKALNIPL